MYLLKTTLDGYMDGCMDVWMVDERLHPWLGSFLWRRKAKRHHGVSLHAQCLKGSVDKAPPGRLQGTMLDRAAGRLACLPGRVLRDCWMAT